MFVELTALITGKKVLVNLHKVEAIGASPNGNVAVFYPALTAEADGMYFEIEESYEKVKQLIADEVAAERGY